jgi:CO dehydrogenase maturation factor
MEASLEHMRRGTVRHVDTMLIVTEPYFRSLETTARLADLGRAYGGMRIAVVANKVRTGEEERAICNFCVRHQLELAAVVPFDPEVTRADNAGLPLMDVAPASTAVAQIVGLARSLDGAKEVA